MTEYVGMFIIVAVLAFGVGFSLGARERKTVPNDYAAGQASAMEVIADTDENAAVLDWVESGRLWPDYRNNSWGEPPVGWSVCDKTLSRANLRANGKTAREAYRKALYVRGAALAICDQLDALKVGESSDA